MENFTNSAKLKKRTKKILKTSVPLQNKNPFLPKSKTLQKNTKIFNKSTPNHFILMTTLVK